MATAAMVSQPPPPEAAAIIQPAAYIATPVQLNYPPQSQQPAQYMTTPVVVAAPSSQVNYLHFISICLP